MTTRKVKIIKVGGKVVCLKRKYYSEREVIDALKSARARGLTDYYQCNICGSEIWHLTSKRNGYRNHT